jgi:hypothetical protein
MHNWIIFLTQGEDVVAGIENREDINFMKNNILEAYVKLLIHMHAIFFQRCS